MAATYDINLATAKDQVRNLIADNANPDPQGVLPKPLFQDEELAWYIAQADNVYFAAADAAEQIAARFAGKADKYVGPLRVMYRDFQDRYRNLAADLRARAQRRRGWKAVLTAPQRPRGYFAMGMNDINVGSLGGPYIDPRFSSTYDLLYGDPADLQSPIV
jgi:hypothetical protein